MAERCIRSLLMLTLFFLPFQTQWIIREGWMATSVWQYGTLSFFISDALIIALIIAIIVQWLRGPRSSIIPRAESRSAFLAMIVFMIWSFLSIWWSLDRWVALWHAAWVLEAGALGFIVFYNRCYRRVMIWSFLIGALFQACIGVTQFVTQMSYASTIMGWALHNPADLGTSVIDTGIRRWLRAYGGMPHPNIFGGFMAISLLLYGCEMQGVLVSLRQRFESSERLAALMSVAGLWLGYCIILIGLLLSFSRSAWLAFVVGFIIWFLGQGRPKPYKQLIATVIVIVIVVVPFWEPFSTRVTVNKRLETKSLEERQGGYRQSWELIKHHPWIGAGIGNYTNSLQVIDDHPTTNDPMTTISMPKKAWDYQPVHNAFVLVLAELGIIGLLLLLLSLWGSFRIMNNELRIMERFTFILHTSYFILPVIILALFDHYLWSLHVGLLIAAAVIALGAIEDKKVSAVY